MCLSVCGCMKAGGGGVGVCDRTAKDIDGPDGKREIDEQEERGRAQQVAPRHEDHLENVLHAVELVDDAQRPQRTHRAEEAANTLK